MIIKRYLFREVMQAFLAVMAVLLLIYVSNRFVRYLAQAASGYISSDLVLELMLLKLAENMSLLLPLALYLAVLLALTRLYRDSEVIAMAASGVGVRHLAISLAWFSLLFAVVAAALSMYFSPAAAALQQEMFERAKGEAQIAGVQPGRFREFGSGQRIAYVESLAPDGRSMRNVFVQVQRDSSEDIIVAESASPALDEVERERYIVLRNGRRYTGYPGRRDFVVTQFERHAVRVETPGGGETVRELEARPSLELLQQADDPAFAELQWRVSIPLSIVLLTLMAVVMSRTTPRQGRYARLIFAFLIYFLYNNALGIARTLVERGDVSALIGVWPVHLVFALAVGVALYRQSTGRWPRPWPRRRNAQTPA